MLQTLEKLVDRYLRDGPLQKFKIHPNQHAYQPRKSVESALHLTVNRIEKAIHHSQVALGSFVDLSNAFSNITFTSIIKSCREHDADDTTPDWIYAMLSSRVISAKLGSVRIVVLTSKGCPQGGVLPPLLYFIVKDSLLKHYQSSLLVKSNFGYAALA